MWLELKMKFQRARLNETRDQSPRGYVFNRLFIYLFLISHDTNIPLSSSLTRRSLYRGGCDAPGWPVKSYYNLHLFYSVYQIHGKAEQCPSEEWVLFKLNRYKDRNGSGLSKAVGAFISSSAISVFGREGRKDRCWLFLFGNPSFFLPFFHLS